MKLIELLQEETKIKGFLPFNSIWKFYKVTKEDQFGGYRTTAGEIIAIGKVKGKNVAWTVFDAFSPRKLGEFFIIDENDNIQEKLGLRPVPYTIHDAHMAFLYIQWDSAKGSKRAQIAEQILALESKISKEFKKSPGTLYRGFHLTPEQMQAIKNRKRIQLSNAPLSSWTHSQGSAYPFTKGHGIVIEKTFSPAEIVVNLQALDDAFNLPLAERWAKEYEVLIHNNGIGQVLDPNKETLSFEED